MESVLIVPFPSYNLYSVILSHTVSHSVTLSHTQLYSLLISYANRKELNLLQKLYSLYNAVLETVNGYYDIPWTDIDIEAINTQLLDFQNK